MTLGERIRKVRTSQNRKISQEAFADELGLTRAQIKTYELDTVQPGMNVLKLIAQTYNVRLDWLIDEEGPMTIPPDEDDELIDEILAGKDEFIKALFREIAKRPEGWAYLRELHEAVEVALNKNKTPEK